MNCSKCGNEISKDDESCTKCGTKINKESSVSKPTRNKKTNNVVCVALTCIMGILTLLVSFYYIFFTVSGLGLISLFISLFALLCIIAAVKPSKVLRIIKIVFMSFYNLALIVTIFIIIMSYVEDINNKSYLFKYMYDDIFMEFVLSLFFVMSLIMFLIFNIVYLSVNSKKVKLISLILSTVAVVLHIIASIVLVLVLKDPAFTRLTVCIELTLLTNIFGNLASYLRKTSKKPGLFMSLFNAFY